MNFLSIPPGRYFSDISTPIFVAACTEDTLAPAEKTVSLAKNAKKSVCKRYNCGHFEVYSNEYFEEAMYVRVTAHIFRLLTAL